MKTMRRIGRAGMVLAAVCAVAWSAPAAAQDLRVIANFDNPAVYVSEPDERYLEIEVDAPDEYRGRVVERRPPLNIALVIDKSGSMAESRKLDYVKEAAHALVDHLRPGDRFALVAYDDRVEVPLPSESFEDRREAHRIIDRIRPEGATNLGGGLDEGFRQVRRRFDPGAINRVLLLSDGLANRGITDPDRLSEMAWRDAEEGVSLTTFGVGLDFNEDLLAGLAESGRGTYYYIDQPRRIPDLLAQEFSTLQRVYAADVVVVVELNADIVIQEVLGYRHRRDGNRYEIHLGNLAGGERRRVMCRISPPRRRPGLHRIGEVRVRYQPPGERRQLSARRELEMHWLDDRTEVRRRYNREVSERSAVFGANVARQKAARMVDRGDVQGAKKVLEENKRQLEAAPVQSEVVRKEIEENAGYGKAISAPMSAPGKAAVQKEIKYKSYRVLQQK